LEAAEAGEQVHIAALIGPVDKPDLPSGRRAMLLADYQAWWEWLHVVVLNTESGGVQVMTDRYLTFKTDAKGRTVIPAALRAAAGIREEGDVLVGYVEDGRLVVETRAAIRRRIRAQAAARRTEGVVDRLLADRQADLELENGDSSPRGRS
jgi:bifunctional DNA-binding transcriptional regulator/antitoxin component of YhaV-PrlF toxin-antitoxin module